MININTILFLAANYIVFTQVLAYETWTYPSVQFGNDVYTRKFEFYAQRFEHNKSAVLSKNFYMKKSGFFSILRSWNNYGKIVANINNDTDIYGLLILYDNSPFNPTKNKYALNITGYVDPELSYLTHWKAVFLENFCYRDVHKFDLDETSTEQYNDDLIFDKMKAFSYHGKFELLTLNGDFAINWQDGCLEVKIFFKNLYFIEEIICKNKDYHHL